MRRLALVLPLAAAVVALWPAATISRAAGESGPSCADIVGETHNYTYSATAGTGSLSLQLLLPDGVSSCKHVTYTLVVSGVNGSPVVTSQTGSTQFVGITFGDADNKICISATTTSSGGHLYDAAPDLGCLEITAGASGGTSGFN